MRKVAVSAIVLLCGLAQIAMCMAADPPKTGAKRDTMIYVRTSPQGAKVLLDGKEIGITNGLFPADGGVATIILQLQGHEEVKRQITIRADEITRIMIELKPQTATEAAESGSPSVQQAVEEAVTTISHCAEGDPRVEQALKSLRPLDQAEVVKTLVPYLGSSTATMRRSAIYILWQGKFRDIKPAVAALEKLLGHNEEFTRGMAALALGQNKVSSSYDALVKMTASDSSAYARRCGAIALGWLGDTKARPTLEKALKDSPTVAASAKVALALLGTGQKPAEKSESSDDTASSQEKDRLAAQQTKARQRMRQDTKAYSAEELREIETLYQVANKQWRTPEARDSLKKLVEKYKKANRTGCAILYLGQFSRGDQQIEYLKQAIADFSDCYYGNGVQVGAFARLLLGHVYLRSGKADLAKKLFDEIRTDYPDAVDHSGRSLVAKLPGGEGEGGAADASTEAPRIVSLSPANGATNVDPATKVLRVTFDVPMAGGFSWTGGGPNFPKTTGKPHWTADHKTCILPVELKPDWEYRLGLNSLSFKNFRSRSGVPLEPVEYRFSTRGETAEAETPSKP
jgi:tetratricopeptide (TPR) repeat protein